MNFNTIVFLLLFFFLAVVGVFYSISQGVFGNKPEIVAVSPTPYPNPSISPEPTDSMMQPNIVVTTPVEGETVSSTSLKVSGQARVFENVVNIRLKEKSGKLLAQTIVEAKSPDVGQFGPFEKTITYPKATDKQGILEVFTLSAKDGSEIEKVVININFQ
jgi:hypothetical protein